MLASDETLHGPESVSQTRKMSSLPPHTSHFLPKPRFASIDMGVNWLKTSLSFFFIVSLPILSAVPQGLQKPSEYREGSV